MLSHFPIVGELVLVIHGFEAGQLAVCSYRLPSDLQP